MKKLFFIYLIILTGSLAAQTTLPLRTEINGVLTRNVSTELTERSRILFLGFVRLPDGDVALVKKGERIEKISVIHLNRITFEPANLEEFWISKAIENGVYNQLMRNGNQMELRKELDDEVLEYMNYLQSNDLFYQDSYIESYLNSLALKISPKNINDGRPGFIHIKIVKDTTPNAHIYSNGTMLINKGLLSVVHSEEELMAVLAHEISHFFLDHSVLNIDTVVARQRCAEFWASLATGLVAATEIYTAARNPNYYPGDITMAT